MIKKSILSISFMAICLGVTSAIYAAVPSDKEIIKNIINIDDSNASPKTAIVIETIEPIILRSGEVGYLSGVSFENSGRNFWAGYILTRPKLKQSKILNFGGQSNSFEIIPYQDVNKKIDLVEIESAGSGQGQISSRNDLVYFDGWDAKIITNVESSSSPGRYNDATGDDDCKTGEDIEGILKVFAERHEVLKITKTSDACKNSKVMSKLEKVKIVIQ